MGSVAVSVELPSDVLAIRSSSLHRLFEAASVVIHAGGIGSTGQAHASTGPVMQMHATSTTANLLTSSVDRFSPRMTRQNRFAGFPMQSIKN